MRRVPQPNVLFVNIGWAPRYDGNHQIQGGHGDIKSQGGNPQTLGEGKAFLLDSNGQVRCVVGRGKVHPNSQIDVVFVARNPDEKCYEIVGIYFDPQFVYSNWTNPKGNTALWADAITTDFQELLGSQRPSIVWPPGWSMRRWARRRGTIRYPVLYDQYVALT